ncbi:MAG: MGMT family protein [Candidatus Bathyarchaeota archaeon]|nr:MAG: MGMT family protein [Candidatus Bathyarchaeota archaeon]
MRKKKSWVEKLNNSKGLPRVAEITKKMRKKWGKGTIVIPAPLEVDALMRQVPRGKLVTINQIRVALAKKHNATIGCPITTGIFASIAAHAADEQREEGIKDITPYWRVLRADGVINPKYPGGVEGQRTLLEEEGHTVIPRGKKLVVADYVKSLVKLHDLMVSLA